MIELQSVSPAGKLKKNNPFSTNQFTPMAKLTIKSTVFGKEANLRTRKMCVSS